MKPITSCSCQRETLQLQRMRKNFYNVYEFALYNSSHLKFCSLGYGTEWHGRLSTDILKESPSSILQNISSHLTDYMASHPRRPSFQVIPWEPETIQSKVLEIQLYISGAATWKLNSVIKVKTAILKHGNHSLPFTAVIFWSNKQPLQTTGRNLKERERERIVQWD